MQNKIIELNKSNFNQKDIKESIKFIESAIEKGIFNELAYAFWANENFKFYSTFKNYS